MARRKTNNKDIIRRVIRELDRGNLDVIDECFAADVVIHGFPMPNGREAFKQVGRTFLAAMHGFRTTIDEQFVSGDRVVTIFTHHGRHIGDFAGIPGTGREVTWTGIQIDRLRDGKVVEMWVQFDQHGLFEQIRAARDGVPA